MNIYFNGAIYIRNLSMSLDLIFSKYRSVYQKVISDQLFVTTWQLALSSTTHYTMLKLSQMKWGVRMRLPTILYCWVAWKCGSDDVHKRSGGSDGELGGRNPQYPLQFEFWLYIYLIYHLSAVSEFVGQSNIIYMPWPCSALNIYMRDVDDEFYRPQFLQASRNIDQLHGQLSTNQSEVFTNFYFYFIKYKTFVSYLF